MINPVSISTVTPVYRGAKYLDELIRELSLFKTSLKETYPGLVLQESIFVLDNPVDNSSDLLEEITKDIPWITVLTLSRNFGQHPATICGILHSSSDWVVTLDEDLQHKPSFIIELLRSAVLHDEDICYANPEASTHKSFFKDFVARSFKRTMAVLLKNPNINFFNSFRIVRGDIARAASAICRHETYLDVALSWFTTRVNHVVIPLVDKRNASKSGESGYSVIGLIRHAKRMLMSSKVKIFRIGIPLGVLAFSVSILLAFYAISATILNFETVFNKGWTSTILAVLFFGGLTSLLTGFALETISEVLISVNGKPTFFVVDRTKDQLIKEMLLNNNNPV